MLRTLRTRRRPRYGASICAAASAVLLLLSVTLLHSRLGFDRDSDLHSNLRAASYTQSNPRNPAVIFSDQFLDNVYPEVSLARGTDDPIDEFDDPDPDQEQSRVLDEDDEEIDQSRVSRVSGYFFDHVVKVVRRRFNKKSIDQWDEDYNDANLNNLNLNYRNEDSSKAAFGSDDFPVDEEVRRKVGKVKSVEDALFLKTGGVDSVLTEGWGDWFDKKSAFLRKDRMFRSNMELLNPLNHPLLQDPDGVSLTFLTRDDKLIRNKILVDFKKLPVLGKKQAKNEMHRSESKRTERKTLDNNVGNESYAKRNVNVASHMVLNSGSRSSEAVALGVLNDENEAIRTRGLDTKRIMDSDMVLDSNNIANSLDNSDKKEAMQLGALDKNREATQVKLESLGQIYADGNRWGYFPGLHPHLSFSNFMNEFSRKGKCYMRVFMIWNSPPWMFSVRHQRGLESLLSHHRDACVVIFSETIELDFFKDFVKDGFKIAVAMPNLDELLMDTPAHIFSTVWFEWRKTKFYSTHYSELVRLAVLYKYGGIYLDSDIIVLKPLTALINSVGMEDQKPGSSLNGAVMAFRKHSPFIMECLSEFYSTYDDTRFRWNGADLLTRVSRSFLSKGNLSNKPMELKVQPFHIFFPINSRNITR